MDPADMEAFRQALATQSFRVGQNERVLQEIMDTRSHILLIKLMDNYRTSKHTCLLHLLEPQLPRLSPSRLPLLLLHLRPNLCPWASLNLKLPALRENMSCPHHALWLQRCGMWRQQCRSLKAPIPIQILAQLTVCLCLTLSGRKSSSRVMPRGLHATQGFIAP